MLGLRLQEVVTMPMLVFARLPFVQCADRPLRGLRAITTCASYDHSAAVVEQQVIDWLLLCLSSPG